MKPPPLTATARARVWTVGEGKPFPERDHIASSRRPATGVCLSGGGTRSVAAAMGQLRGLSALGLLDEIGYLSAVSGGAWAAAPYVFADGGVEERDRLGPVLRPESLTLEGLEALDERRLAWPATREFEQTLHRLVQDQDVPRQVIWTRAVGHTFLEPLGLFDPRRPSAFTLDAATESEIRRRIHARDGAPIRFDLAGPSGDRPFLVISTTLRWPDALEDGRRWIGFEMTPLYVGIPGRLGVVTGSGAQCTVGGYLEPFAFGCQAPSIGPDASGLLRVALPATPFSLADVLGLTSARAAEDDSGCYPSTELWRFDDPSPAPHRVVFTDGGDIENYGLMSLLRRRVERIVVFINSESSLSPTYDPTKWPPEFARPVDLFLPPLFGQTTTRFQHNHVFRSDDYAPLVRTLQTAKRSGVTVRATTTLDVQANGHWSVPGGWQTTICWIYNDRVPLWEARLAPALRRAIEEGQGEFPAGPFARFPNYRTRGQNPGALIRLTPAQVNLLAELSCWNVMAEADEIHRLFTR